MKVIRTNNAKVAASATTAPKGKAQAKGKTPATKASKGKAQAKAKASVPAPKATPAPSAIGAGEWFAATGTKGTALFKGSMTKDDKVLPLETSGGRRFESPMALPLGKSVIVWKGTSEISIVGKAGRGWVSNAGQPVTLERLKTAKACHRLNATVNGKKQPVWVPVSVRSGMKAPQYVGVELPGGRVETKSIAAQAAGKSDNMTFAGTVVL